MWGPELWMVQESVAWDTLNMIKEPSGGYRVYVLFLIVVCIATGFQLIRIWRLAPPFRFSRQVKNPEYLKLLRVSSHALSHWMALVFLGWAFASSFVVYRVCAGVDLQKATGLAVLQFLIRDLAMTFGMALIVVLLIFLARWHVSNRIETFRD